MKCRPLFLSCVLFLALAMPGIAHSYVEWYRFIRYDSSPFLGLPETNVGAVGGDNAWRFVVARQGNSPWKIGIYDVRTGAMEYEHDILQTIELIHLADVDGDSVPEIIVRSSGYITVIGHQPPVTVAVEPTQMGTRSTGALPNPSISRTSLAFELTADGKAQLEVFDISGRLLRKLVDARMKAGPYRVQWDRRDDAGVVLPAGTYFYRVSLDDRVIATNKVIRLAR